MDSSLECEEVKSRVPVQSSATVKIMQVRRHATRLIIAGLVCVTLMVWCAHRVEAVDPRAALPYDSSPGKVLFSIETRGGVASKLQELTALPDFVLYGDGTAIWTRYNTRADLRVVWSVKLNTDEIKKDLEYIDSLGYNGWYDRYEDAPMAHLPTTTFTLNYKEQPIKRLVYGLQYCVKNKVVPEGFGQIYEHFSRYKHPDEGPYEFERVVVFARRMTKLEARRGFRTLNWGIKPVNLSEFARDSQTDYGQKELSGKEARRVIDRLKQWTLFSTDLSVVFFREKKVEYQLGYRPVLPGE